GRHKEIYAADNQAIVQASASQGCLGTKHEQPSEPDMCEIHVPCSPHGAHQSAAAMAKPEDRTGANLFKDCLQHCRNVELSHRVKCRLPRRRSAFPVAPPIQYPAA